MCWASSKHQRQDGGAGENEYGADALVIVLLQLLLLLFNVDNPGVSMLVILTFIAFVTEPGVGRWCSALVPLLLLLLPRIRLIYDSLALCDRCCTAATCRADATFLGAAVWTDDDITDRVQPPALRIFFEIGDEGDTFSDCSLLLVLVLVAVPPSASGRVQPWGWTPNREGPFVVFFLFIPGRRMIASFNVSVSTGGEVVLGPVCDPRRCFFVVVVVDGAVAVVVLSFVLASISMVR